MATTTAEGNDTTPVKVRPQPGKIRKTKHRFDLTSAVPSSPPSLSLSLSASRSFRKQIKLPKRDACQQVCLSLLCLFLLLSDALALAREREREKFFALFLSFKSKERLISYSPTYKDQLRYNISWSLLHQYPFPPSRRQVLEY